MSGRPANDEMVEGYFDGYGDDRDKLPESLANRSDSYKHGWLNGRDDRVGKPRRSAGDLGDLADEIMAREIAADYARSRRASDRADAWLSVCAYVMIGLAIVIGMAHWGLR